MFFISRKNNRFIFSLILSSTLIASCVSDEYVNLGSKIIQSDSRIIYVDDLDVKVSTFMYDSLVTSGKNLALIGRFTDNTIGPVQSGSFIPLGSNSIRITGDNAVFDSIEINLYHSGYIYGDSLINTTLNVHRVTEEIKFGDNSTTFYNNSSFQYDPEPIGSLEYFVVPHNKERLTIKLSQEIGEEIFGYLRLPVRPSIEEEGFARYFRGIYIEPGSTSNSILGYLVNDTSLYMKVYYHLGNETETNHSYNITCLSTTQQFNKISNDNSNSIIGKLSETPINSDSTNNCGFIQGGSGIFTRIDFPNLREYFQQSSKYEIVKAELQICPSKEMNLDYLPQKLNVYYTNKNNELISVLSNSSGVALDGSLVKDEVFYGKTYYSWDVTSFIKSIALTSDVDNDGLLIIPAKYNDTFDQMIVADKRYADSQTKLKLYLLSHE